jgi:hypothetical protein
MLYLAGRDFLLIKEQSVEKCDATKDKQDYRCWLHNINELNFKEAAR